MFQPAVSTLVVGFVIGIGVVWWRQMRKSSKASADKPEDVGRDLRQMVLTTPPGKMGLKSSPEFPRVYGMLIDFPIDNQIASIFSTCQGTASLYTTSTFGIIGGEGHDSVRNASLELVRTADRFLDSSAPTAEHPYPTSGCVRFYFLTFGGLRVIETDLDSVAEQRTSPFTELFDLGQNVLTQLRLATEERR